MQVNSNITVMNRNTVAVNLGRKHFRQNKKVTNIPFQNDYDYGWNEERICTENSLGDAVTKFINRGKSSH